MQDEKLRHVEISVDRESMISYHDTPNIMIPMNLLKDFSKFKVIDEKYWYTTSNGAEAYIMLNHSERAYIAFNDSLKVLGNVANDIVDKVFDLFKESAGKYGDKDPKIDFIPLGIGTAEKEMKILEEFLVTYKDKWYKSKMEPVTLRPVDLSYILLMRSVDFIYDKFKAKISRDELKVKPHMMDFQIAKFDDFGDSKYRLITALGIIPNTTMPRIFKILEGLMQKESLLLIDVGMIVDDESIIASYEDEAVKQFITSPMKLILKTAKYSNEIRQFDSSSYQSVKAYEDLEMNFDDVHAEITTEDRLNQFIKDHNLPSSSKEKILVNSSEGSKTIVILYDPPGKNTPCVLGYSTLFTPEGMDKMLSKTNLEIVGDPYTHTGKNIVYYLLRLKRGSAKNKASGGSKSTGKQKVSI